MDSLTEYTFGHETAKNIKLLNGLNINTMADIDSITAGGQNWDDLVKVGIPKELAASIRQQHSVVVRCLNPYAKQERIAAYRLVEATDPTRRKRTRSKGKP